MSGTSRIRLNGFVLAVYLSFVGVNFSSAQEMPVPVDVQYPLLLKILTFDKNLKARVGNEIVCGIVYQKKFRTSLNVKDELLRVIDSLALRQIDGIPVRYIAIDVGDDFILENAILENNVNVLYIAPVRALDIGKITAISRSKRLLTLTGVPEYVESGLSVAIAARGEKPQIMINLNAAKAEGSDFSSQLLKLAKIIDRNE